MEQVKKMFIFLKSIFAKYYLAFLCGLATWMLFDVYVFKGIDASFISACADVSLVVFAFIALLEAKKEWDKRLKQDGYKIAAELMNDRFIKLFQASNDLNYKIKNVENSVLSIIHCLPKNDITVKDAGFSIELTRLSMNLKEKFDRLSEGVRLMNEDVYDKLFPLSQETQFTILRMRNSSVDFSDNESGVLIKSHFDSFSTLTIKSESCCVAIRQYLFLMKMPNNPFNEVDGYIIGKNNYNHLKDIYEIKDSINEVKALTNTMRNNLNAITLAAKDKKTIADYFDLN